MTLRLTLIFCFTMYSSLLFAQASWGYSVKFKLISKTNDTISVQNFKDGTVKLLSAPFGAHSNNTLAFDSITNTFKFSQQTIATNSILVFQTLKDTTVLNIQTINLDLGHIMLTGHEYSFNVWTDDKRFIKSKIDDKYWKRKHSFKYYISTNRGKLIRTQLKTLMEVELK